MSEDAVDEPAITDANLRELYAYLHPRATDTYAYHDAAGALRLRTMGLADAVRAEVERRAARMAPHVPDAPAPVPVIRIDGGAAPLPRHGACMTCGEALLTYKSTSKGVEPLPVHEGGMCNLCCAALRVALRQAGRIE